VVVIDHHRGFGFSSAHPEKDRMKTCLLMAGIPGSGKSTFAKAYAAKSHPNTVVVDTDETRKQDHRVLFGVPAPYGDDLR
jgi:adenylylsulfate kinase-like enzyme